jgi:hypothetical protein
MPFSVASFRTAGVALTSERSGRSAVAVDEADEDGCGDEDDEEDDVEEGGGGDDVEEGGGGDAVCEGAEGVGSDGS